MKFSLISFDEILQIKEIEKALVGLPQSFILHWIMLLCYYRTRYYSSLKIKNVATTAHFCKYFLRLRS